MNNELHNCFGHFLGDRVELTHQFALWDSMMKQSDEYILELVEILEFREIMLGVPTR